LHRSIASPALRGVPWSAFLTVQEGCDKFCTFCVVPYTRGAEVSRPADRIVAEASRLAAGGVREITLLGQNVNAWHGDGPGRAPVGTWPAAVPPCRNSGLDRLRYTTSHPRDMDDDLIAAHRDLDALMPYLHLPVQSGSDRILAAMNRRHTRADYLRLVDRIRAARPDIALAGRFHRRLPRRERRRFRRHAKHRRRRRATPRPSRSSTARAPERQPPCPTSKFPSRSKTSACSAAGVDRGAPAGVHDVAHRHGRRGSVREAGQAPRPDRRPLAVADPGSRRGAGSADRLDCPRPPYRRRNQQSCRRSCRSAVGGAAAGRHGVHRLTARHDFREPAARDGRDHIVVAFDDNRLTQELFGEFDQNLAVIEQRLGVEAVARGNQVTIRGDAAALGQARLALDTLYHRLQLGTLDCPRRRRRGRAHGGRQRQPDESPEP
jgi:hypothetical protein